MIPVTIYPQRILDAVSQPEYFVAHCSSNHVFVAPESYRNGVCPVCEHQGRPFVPPNHYPCRHCNEFPTKHAVIENALRWRWEPKLACLFSPTQYEPMTQAELELRVR